MSPPAPTPTAERAAPAAGAPTLVPPADGAPSPAERHVAAPGDAASTEEAAEDRAGDAADDAALLVAAVAEAVLAPSGHNAQPWRFRLRRGAATGAGPALECRADRTRALPVVDPDDRALVIGCGAALAHVRVALAAIGRTARVARLPDADDPDLLAEVRVGPPGRAAHADQARLAAIAHRRTTRRPFAAEPVPLATLGALVGTARREGAWLRVVSAADEREAVAALVAEGDRRQAADPAFRRELAAWMHPDRARTRDGIPTSAFGVPAPLGPAFPWVIRTFDWGDGQAARDRQLALGSPVLAVLGTAGDEPLDWLRAGEALALVLLDATAHGLAASFLNQPIEVPALRARLTGTLDLPGSPQLLLRLGVRPRDADVPPTPRRGVAEVLDVR